MQDDAQRNRVLGVKQQQTADSDSRISNSF